MSGGMVAPRRIDAVMGLSYCDAVNGMRWKMKTTIESLEDVRKVLAFLVEKEKEGPKGVTTKEQERKKGRIEGVEMVARFFEGVEIEGR